MSKKVKIIAVVIVVLIVIYVAYLYMKPSPASQFTSTNGADIMGFDIEENVVSGTVDEDAAKAIAMGAVSFMRRGGRTWFKSAKGPVTTNNTGGVLYIKK